MSETRVYSYGAAEPITHAGDISEHIRRANRYRNALCQMELERREKVYAAQRKHFPRIAELEGESSIVEKQLEAAREKVAKHNSEKRKRKGSPDVLLARGLKEKLKTLRDELRARRSEAFGPPELRKARKEYGIARKDALKRLKTRNTAADPKVASAREKMNELHVAWLVAVPKAKQFTSVLEEIERWANREGRRLYLLFGDLPWGTRGAILKAAKTFRQGTPPRFKSFRGDGREGVQTMESPTVRDVLGATQGQLSVSGYDPEGGKQLATVKLRIGTNEESKAPVWADVPVVFHRPLPEDAKIKYAFLRQRRIGTITQRRMQFTLSRDADRWTKPRLAERGRVAMDLGWRIMDDGSLRCAYWVGDDGREGELRLPAKMLGRMIYVDGLRSDRDREFNRVRDWLVERYRELKEPPAWLAERLSAKNREEKSDGSTVEKRGAFTLHQWRSTAKLAAVVIHWRERRFAGDDAIVARLETWRAWDERELNHEAWTREETIAWRDEIFKIFAATMRRDYRTLVIEDVDWAEMKRKGHVEEEKPRLVGWHMVAAPGRLEEILGREMRETIVVKAEQTIKCSVCGKPTLEPRKAKLMHTCRHCKATADQDRSAAVNALAVLV